MKTYMKFYRNHFQFKLPYQVLIDGTFCHEALQCKLNIKEQVPHYLEDENVRLFTTACVIKEVEMLGKVFIYNINFTSFFTTYNYMQPKKKDSIKVNRVPIIFWKFVAPRKKYFHDRSELPQNLDLRPIRLGNPTLQIL